MKRILLAVCLSVSCFGALANVEETAIRALKQGDIVWVKKPRIHFNNDELQGYDRTVLVGFSANERGLITSAKVVESSGLDELDIKVLMAVRRSEVRPYNISAVQPFTMMVIRKGEFEIKPNIIAKRSLLLGKERSVEIYSEADENGYIAKAKVSRSSMVPELDAYVLKEFKRQAKFKPISVNGMPYHIKETSRFYFGENYNTRD